MTSSAESRQAQRLGSVEAYCLERLFPGAGSISIDAIFADYHDWCETQGQAPQDRPGFDLALQEIAVTLDIAVSAGALSGVRLACASGS